MIFKIILNLLSNNRKVSTMLISLNKKGKKNYIRKERDRCPGQEG